MSSIKLHNKSTEKVVTIEDTSGEEKTISLPKQSGELITKEMIEGVNSEFAGYKYSLIKRPIVSNKTIIIEVGPSYTLKTIEEAIIYMEKTYGKPIVLSSQESDENIYIELEDGFTIDKTIKIPAITYGPIYIRSKGTINIIVDNLESTGIFKSSVPNYIIVNSILNISGNVNRTTILFFTNTYKEINISRCTININLTLIGNVIFSFVSSYGNLYFSNNVIAITVTSRIPGQGSILFVNSGDLGNIYSYSNVITFISTNKIDYVHLFTTSKMGYLYTYSNTLKINSYQNTRTSIFFYLGAFNAYLNNISADYTSNDSTAGVFFCRLQGAGCVTAFSIDINIKGTSKLNSIWDVFGKGMINVGATSPYRNKISTITHSELTGYAQQSISYIN